MGNHESSHKLKSNNSTKVTRVSQQPVQQSSPAKFSTILDHYESIPQLQEALEQAGLESSNLIIGVDYTISNTSAGKRTFNNQSLHSLSNQYMNPYQHVISVLSRTLERFDDDRLIPAFGFGDKTTKDEQVFPFFPDARPCRGVDEMLQRYAEITPGIALGGPTSFAPLIHEAIRIVKVEKSYHILIIIADGQMTPDSEWTTCTKDTTNAIVEASSYPISIIVVGVGDGPWDQMEIFDDQLPQRKFDNFQFVDFHKEIGQGDGFGETNFALAALQEIPEQYLYIKKHGMI
jgi:hypothetical protein